LGNPKILTTNDCPLLNTPFSVTRLAAADAEMSPELVNDFLKIGDQLLKLKKTMEEEAEAACKSLSTDDNPQNLDVNAIAQTVRSIDRAVNILQEKSPITTEEFYKAWASQRVLEMANDFLADQQKELEAFTGSSIGNAPFDLPGISNQA